MSEALEKGDLKGLFVNLKKQVCKIIGFILIPEHRSFVKNWTIFFALVYCKSFYCIL